jgi:hypothetical protein
MSDRGGVAGGGWRADPTLTHSLANAQPRASDRAGVAGGSWHIGRGPHWSLVDRPGLPINVI